MMPMYKKCIRCLLFTSPRRVQHALLFLPHMYPLSLSVYFVFSFCPLKNGCVVKVVNLSTDRALLSRRAPITFHLSTFLFQILKKFRISFSHSEQFGSLAVCASSTSNVSSVLQIQCLSSPVALLGIHLLPSSTTYRRPPSCIQATPCGISCPIHYLPC